MRIKIRKTLPNQGVYYAIQNDGTMHFAENIEEYLNERVSESTLHKLINKVAQLKSDEFLILEAKEVK